MDLPEGNYTYQGIGVQIKGWHLIPTSEEVLVCWESDNCDPHSEDCYQWEHDWIVTDFLEVVWVGDDTVHLVELEDLVKLDEGHHICSCGMVDCWASGTDYE